MSDLYSLYNIIERKWKIWYIIKHFLNADAKLPKESLVFHGDDRFVCRQLEQRRDFSVVSVLEALEVMKQPHLLQTTDTQANIIIENGKDTKINTIIAPFSLYK